MSFFQDVILAPPDPILGLTTAFLNDPRKNKVNLGVGIYKSEDLKAPILHSVKMAEKALWEQETTKEYLPIDGEALFIEGMGKLVFDASQWKKEKSRISACQTVGGTGALKIGGTFLKEEVDRPIWISNPTWPNHRGVFLSCGLSVENYAYYDQKAHQIDFKKMIGCFEKLPEKTIVAMHASCHNPTGCDPTFEEWKILCELFKTKKLIPFFDFAYQGFGRSLDLDAEVLRFCLEKGLEMLVAVSSAKNFSLYGERVGCLFIVSETSKIAEHILSRVKQIIRTTYSNPPMHGAKIVGQILQTSFLCKMWEEELGVMRVRIQQMRKELFNRLASHGKTQAFEQINRGQGMFGYTGLSRPQVERLSAEYGIYMTADGRMNVCGLNLDNIDYVVEAILSVIS